MVFGQLFTIATFPGVILHELAHKLACEKTGLRVSQVCYFRLGNPAGYVIHEQPRKFSQAFLITVAPFLLNTALAIIMYILALLTPAPLQYLFFWLGISFASHAFPSRGDAKSLYHFTKRTWKSNPVTLLAIPVIILIYIGSILSIFWFDLLYALALIPVTAKFLGVSVPAWAPDYIR